MAKKSTKSAPARAGGQKAAKESARERVAAARAAQARKERRARVAFISALSIVGVAAAGGIVWAVTAHGGSGDGKASGPLPAPVAYGSSTMLPPWAAPANASAGAKAAGLKVSAMEGTVNHFHAHLDVIVDGKAVPVPANLGIDQAAQAMSELHTHDAAGVVHVEAPAHRRYILGQLFNEWGVRLDAQGIGGLTAGGGKTLAAYVDGKRVAGDPASIELTAHREIALVFGVPDSKLKVPSSFDFPQGE
ncbi:hypothetical protein QMK19_08560 [Streptomyces sp. H10-C2]|uniref:hypothetical protein n=1 Tax=unclassified Streptomyces TaxID=2593676 RepID=UPI0024BBB7F9|nr:MULTISPECIES: hypothetical protein [unclassified Streptomyces]MDJ0341039.1 hypothetical protein [Streptomyces sp. PH10-H1]MDJ0369729.1 hypothetical protein [Streptomyces sp. H10-C2]